MQKQLPNEVPNGGVEAEIELEVGEVGSQTKATDTNTDEPPCSKEAIDEEPRDETDGQTTVKPPLQRPNLLKVLKGTQWNSLESHSELVRWAWHTVSWSGGRGTHMVSPAATV